MGNIGNMNPNFPVSVAEFPDGKCIIKIFGIFWIYGESEYFPHIPAFFYFALMNFSIDGIRFFFYFFREMVGESVFCQNGMNLGFMFSGSTQNLNNFTFRIFVPFSPAQHFYYDLISGIGAVKVFFFHENISMNNLLVSDYKAKFFMGNVIQSAYKISFISLQNLDY